MSSNQARAGREEMSDKAQKPAAATDWEDLADKLAEMLSVVLMRHHDRGWIEKQAASGGGSCGACAGLSCSPIKTLDQYLIAKGQKPTAGRGKE